MRGSSRACRPGELRSSDAGSVRKPGGALELVLPRDPVVCLDGDFKVEGVGSPEIAVRVRPDHWPPFADPAWMDVETVSDDPELSAMVEPLDRYRLAAGS